MIREATYHLTEGLKLAELIEEGTENGSQSDEDFEDPKIALLRSYYGLGQVNSLAEKPLKSIEYFGLARGLLSNNVSEKERIMIFLGLANAYMELHQEEDAKSVLDNCIEIVEEWGHDKDEGDTLIEMGNYYHYCGDFQTAKKFFEQCASLGSNVLGLKKLDDVNYRSAVAKDR